MNVHIATVYEGKKPYEKKKDDNIEGPSQCYTCGESFDSQILVKEHLIEKHKSSRNEHYGKIRSHQCHVCKAMFESEEKKSYHRCILNSKSEQTSDQVLKRKNIPKNSSESNKKEQKKIACKKYAAHPSTCQIFSQLDFGLYWGWIEAGPKLFDIIWSLRG